MDLRERILQAADHVIRTNGLARTTTKEIARVAHCSEGSLYNHFQSKEDLFVQMIKGHLQHFLAVLHKLPERVGTRTVKENLQEVAHAAIEYFRLSIVMTASMFTEPSFLSRHRGSFVERNEGPHRANEILGAYLGAEQELGRANSAINPRSAADLLLGACFQHVFHLQFRGVKEPEEEEKRFIVDLVQTLLLGADPK